MPFHYCPIIKTTAAELRGLANLSANVSAGILPIIELTRSRRSKHNPDGRIEKRIEQIEEILDERPFILDVTTQESMSNSQIDGMLHGAPGGFKEWVKWIKGMRERDLQVIPMIHHDPDCADGTKMEIDELRKVAPCLAFRADPFDAEMPNYLALLQECMSLSDVILILDAGYLSLSLNKAGDYASYFDAALDRVEAVDPLKAVVCAFSSFPDSVTRKNYGDDESGEFPVAELITHRRLQKRRVVAGDYASVHPIRYNTGGGTWIPRIDFIVNDNFHYHRYRREDGGYVQAAQSVIGNPAYKAATPPTWADNEIELASEGEPTGRSPLHWIAVRVNAYMSRVHQEFREGNHILL